MQWRTPMMTTWPRIRCTAQPLGSAASVGAFSPWRGWRELAIGVTRFMPIGPVGVSGGL